ncbi:MAG: NAD-dependent protein deacylase [Oscillospiraceae bacterium]|nr:NAD-dependent protein deacylase [Oscillospiraceae bacterium]
MTNKTNKTLAQIIKESGNAVFFGGAGVSTESNIPDFRSEGGLYSARAVYGHSPEYLLSRSCFLSEPELFFRYHNENLIYLDAKPNAAHIALAKFERAGLLSAVITQNIDGLHQAAGSQNVLELHGSNSRHYCVKCGEKYPLEYTLDPSNREGFVPKCGKCGGVVRPDVVLYEEPLDDGVVQASIEAIAGAGCMIVGGTSLVVHPAAGLVRLFKGDYLILINKGDTPYDKHADLVIRDSIGRVLSDAAAELGL